MPISWRMLLVAVLFCSAIPLLARGRPVIRRVHGEYTIVLPAAMQRALTGYDSHFTRWRQSDFLPAILKRYHFTNRQTPFAVIGDMNGDRRPDVALLGHNRQHDLLVVVLSRQRGYRVVTVMQWELSDPKQERDDDEFGLWSVLTYNPPGTMKSPFEAHPLKLTTDAFQLVAWEKASTLYYYRHGRFQQYATED